MCHVKMMPIPDTNPHHPTPSIQPPYSRGPLGKGNKSSVQHGVRECRKGSPYEKRWKSRSEVCQGSMGCERSD